MFVEVVCLELVEFTEWVCNEAGLGQSESRWIAHASFMFGPALAT